MEWGAGEHFSLQGITKKHYSGAWVMLVKEWMADPTITIRNLIGSMRRQSMVLIHVPEPKVYLMLVFDISKKD